MKQTTPRKLLSARSGKFGVMLESGSAMKVASVTGKGVRHAEHCDAEEGLLV